MNAVISHLPVVVLNVYSRCNCRCSMCDIWKITEGQQFDTGLLERQLDDFESLGVRWVVFTGGEPLMHPGLFRMCAMVRGRGIRVTVLTTGLLVERMAGAITQHVDDLIVSLDGPAEIHDRIRRVPGGFLMIRAGIAKLKAGCVAVRCTVQKANHASLVATVQAAKEIGAASVSFLAADLTSRAFNRPTPWTVDRCAEIGLTPDELPALDAQLSEMIESRDSFVRDSPEHLRRIARHFRAHLGMVEPQSPKCNAPWVSAVVDVDGGIRPCFFHEPFGNVHSGFKQGLNTGRAEEFRNSLNIETNPVCQSCVCSLSI